MKTYKCICGKEFETNKSLACHKATCKIYRNSDLNNTLESEITKKCVICGKEFKTKFKDRICCSYSCAGIKGCETKKENGLFRKIIKSNCLICGKEIEHFEGSKLHSETCSSSCANRLRAIKNRNIELTKENIENYIKKSDYIKNRPKIIYEHKDITIKCAVCGKEFVKNIIINGKNKPKIPKTCCTTCSHKYQASVRKERNQKLGFADPKTRLKIENTMIKKYGVPYYCMTKECKDQNGSISNVNKKFAKLLDDNNILYEMEFKLNLMYYDFHILNTNILIEINPTYTHNSTIGPHFGSSQLTPKNKEYHYNKTKFAIKNNYKCIHIFDWTDKYKIIELIKNNNFELIEKPNYDFYWCDYKGKNCIKNNKYIKLDTNNLVKVYDDKFEIKECNV